MNENAMDFAVILRVVGGGEVGREAQSLKAELVSIKAVSREAAGGLDQLGASTRKAATEFVKEEQSAKGATGALLQHQNAARGAAAQNTAIIRTSGAASAGLSQLSMQANDVAIQYQMGTAASVIFAQQSGQVIQAVQLMASGMGKAGGAIGSVARFLGGPWGIAIQVGVTALTLFSDELFDTERAAKAAEAGTSGLADAQSVLGDIFDLTSGKIKSQNELLILNARLMAANLRGEALRQRESSQEILGAGRGIGMSNVNNALGFLGLPVGNAFGRANELNAVLDELRTGKLTREQALERVEKLDFSGLDVSLNEVQQAIIDDLAATLKERTALEIDKSLDSKSLSTSLRKDGRPISQINRTNEQAWNDFKRELAKLGIQQASGRTGFRTAKDQNEIYRSGASPLDGFRRKSRHQSYEAFDPTRASHNANAARQAADNAGLKGFEIVRESGGRFHYEWKGHGQKGEADVSGAERAQKAAEDYANKLRDFGIKAQDAIAGINSRFGEQPKLINDAEKATADLDKLIAELTAKKPPNFEKLIADAQAAKTVIQDSLSRPIREMLADQERGIELQRLRSAGRDLEADQLEQQYKLMDMLGAEDANQLAAALAKIGVTKEQYQALFANLGVMRQISDEERKRSAIQQERLSRLDDVRRSTEIFFEDLPSKGFGAVGNLFSDIYNQFKQSLAKQVHDQLLGGIFKEMEDDISGKTALREAEQAMHQTVVETTNAITALGNAAVGATGQLNGQTTIGLDAPDVEQAAQDIIVSGRRDFDVFGKLFTKLFQTFLGKDSELAGDVGKAVGGVLKGMVAGEAASSIAGQLGIKQSKTGAKIGSAVGAMAASAFGLPPEIGGAIGGFWGGTIGGLFKKTKSGGASLNFQNGVLGSSTFGNSRSMQDAASSAMTSVMDGLQNIASQLGGFITGNPSVSIGQYKGKWRVNTTGGTRMKKGAGVTDFGKDGEEAARMFALQDALKDGLISGLSDNVRRALQSSKDINNALREAMQVDQIELLLGGFGTAARKEFVDFERQAKERLRVAGKYGFDLVKLEEANQKERQKLLDNAIAHATGGLKDMLDDMLFGERAAGTLMDRRAELIKKRDELIPLAATDADAAAKLADILNQLYEVSIAAYGSAGAEFAGDRSSIQSAAEDIIAKATAELTAAQKTAMQNAGTATNSTDTLIGQGNQLLTNISGLLDEGNDLQARLLAALRGGSVAGVGFDNNVFRNSLAIGKEVML